MSDMGHSADCDARPCAGRNVNVCVAEGCYGEACIRATSPDLCAHGEPEGDCPTCAACAACRGECGVCPYVTPPAEGDA